jgi:hypothetical protein
MKRVLIIMAAFMLLTSIASAQELGARFGDVSGGDVAIDAVFKLGKFTRTHGDLSFGNGTGVDLLFDFIYRPLDGEAFNWYAGVGPYAVFDDPFTFGFVGEIGLEYRFKNTPISLSGDWRPSFEIVDNTDFHAGGFGFNVRYIFK